MAKEDSVRFVCSQCAYSSPKWLGRCPDCGAWNSFTEEFVSKQKKTSVSENLCSLSLSDVSSESEFRFSSGITELDRVLGGGIVNSSSVLVGGEPGIGKSTLMLQVAAGCSARRKVLYVSGEESASQVKQRAVRLGLDLSRISILCETGVESICQVVRNEKPQLLIVDSLQTLSSNEVASNAGSVTQIRTCCMNITTLCKTTGTAAFFVGHVTKEGTIAGPKIIEHMVDTVLYFEEATVGVRIVRAAKNRFGSVDEIGIFEMDQSGLAPVKDPTTFFISRRDGDKLPPGIVYTTISEGSRTFVVELQALVVDAKSGYSRVYSEKVDSQRVMRVAAILQRHANLILSDKDIYINVAGGVRISEVSVELPLALALISAALNRQINSKTVCFGELSLAGEVRPVGHIEKRLKSAREMGFSGAIVAGGVSAVSGVSLTECSKVTDLFNI